MTYGPQAAGGDQPLTGWERPTGDQQPTGYEPASQPLTGYAPQVPVQGPYPETQAPPPPRRRLWIIAAAAAGALFLIAIVALFIFVPDRSGPADEFDAASKSFHSRVDSLHPKLLRDIQSANTRLMDPSLTPAKAGAEAIEQSFADYANALQAITMPDAALDARNRLIRVTQAGRILMTGIAASFSKAQMQALLDGTWPSVTKALGEAEASLRGALKE